MSNNVTTIEDRSTAGGTSSAPQRAIDVDVNSPVIESDTVLDGFTILGSTQGADHTAAIFLIGGASPTVQNNTINGGSGGSNSLGILSDNSSSPMVYNNSINGGSSGSISLGILSGGSSSTVFYNNTINGGSGSGDPYGMYTTTSSPTVRNNTIYGGSSGSSVGVSNFTNPTIDNNIIFTGNAGGTCIDSESNITSPSSLRNNDLFGCTMIYYDGNAGCTGNGDGDNDPTTCTLTEMNLLTDIPGGVNGNVSVNPQFVNNADWHFSAGSPDSVTAGGLNGLDQVPAWAYTTDKDSVTRPGPGQPWSIGAYEVTISDFITVSAAPSSTSNIQFSATGHYSDGSTRDMTALATWTSSNSATATIDSTGLATINASGQTTITATFETTSGSSMLTVGSKTSTGWNSTIGKAI